MRLFATLHAFIVRYPHYTAIGITGLLSLFTLSTLEQRSVAADEFSMYWAAEKPLSTILRLYFSPYENNPPGCAILQHYWGIIFGFDDAALRLLSLICVWGTLYFVWQLSAAFCHQHSTHSEISLHFLVFVLAGTTPVLWMAANFARYQAMVLFLCTAALYFYVRWLQHESEAPNSDNPRFLMLYATLTGLLFYFHYLSAAMFALCIGVHYLADIHHRSKKQIAKWLLAQAVILFLIAPIVLHIATIYSHMNLATTPVATTNVSKPLAIALFFGATVVGIINGFAVAPWTLWVVIPMIVVTVLLVLLFVKHSSPHLHRLALWCILFPLVVSSIVVVRMYPPLQFYLIPSVQRVGFLAPVFWILMGTALTHVRQPRYRYTLVVTILACNLYGIAVWNLNIVATQHTPPLRELRAFVLQNTYSLQNLVIAHPFGYRYGMESVGSGSSGSATAVDRYLPGTTGIFWLETDMTAPVSVDSCMRFVSQIAQPEFVLVQRNRLHANTDSLAKALLLLGYTVQAEQHVQRQTAIDIWFKAQILRLPLRIIKDEATPQPYLYTMRYYRKYKY
ncbi:MAG: hypothetical protein RML40_11365 [Bacteroidota bacterium]|nr:glycosyltransferase family 39 protein [Candidatus Kapabacteria bacterium]MDW8221114.1 hypothetical protein [Bacteroidota bacterium]